MKKILITGSHGFLARNIAFLLKKNLVKYMGLVMANGTKNNTKTGVMTI